MSVSDLSDSTMNFAILEQKMELKSNSSKVFWFISLKYKTNEFF
jgi:hypothetical protein